MDLNSNAFRIVKSLTDGDDKSKSRSAASRAAGKIGGRSRARTVSAEQRREIAVKANRTRWRKATG